jgi:peroxiredoxin
MLVTVTVAALVAILAVALSRSAGGSAPTPTAVPTTNAAPAPNAAAPDYGGVTPLPHIGVLDNHAGLAQRGAAPKLGRSAPDFDWLTTAGALRLSSLRGHAVLLEFFAPWCPQCQQDVPLLNTLASQPQFKGLQVLSISGTPYGKDYETKGSQAPISIDDLDWFRQHFGALYSFLYDPGSRVFNLYGYGSSYPTFFLIDANGIVRFTTSTSISNADLIAQVMKVV